MTPALATITAAVRPGAEAPSAEDLERIAACGPEGQQAWLCRVVFDVTGSRTAADVADVLSAPFKILVILVVAYLLVRISRRVIKRVVRKLTEDETGHRITTIKRKTGLALLETSPVPTVRRALRAETIGVVLRSVVAFLIWATALVMILEEVGVALGPLLAGAGVVGVALGFGSQSLVRDFLSGLFMLIEDQYGVGDVIDAGEATGTVEGVSLRTTRLRDVQGTVWHIPNGEIRRVGNMSQQWSRALLDVAVAYDTDLERAQAIVKQVADAMWRDQQWSSLILAEPEMWGVEELAPDRVLLRLVVKTKPLEQWRVARELRSRIKDALDQAGIEIPLPQQVVTNRVGRLAAEAERADRKLGGEGDGPDAPPGARDTES